MPPFFCINMLKIPVYYAYIIQNELYLACILRVYCTHITIKNLLKPTNTFFKNTHNKTPETLNFRGSFLLISTHPVLTSPLHSFSDQRVEFLHYIHTSRPETFQIECNVQKSHFF